MEIGGIPYILHSSFHHSSLTKRNIKMASTSVSVKGNAGSQLIGPIAAVDMIGGDEINGAGSLLVPANSQGTYVVEGCPGQNNSVANAGTDCWIQLQLTVPAAGVNAAAASIVGSGADQFGYFEIVALQKVRARRTDGGANADWITLNIKGG